MINLSFSNTSTVDVSAIFNALPGNHILLQARQSAFTVIAVSNDWLQLVAQPCEAWIGKNLVDLYPAPTEDAGDSLTQLQNLLQDVVNTKTANRTLVRGYKLGNNNGTGENRYLFADNKPILNDNGEVIYILHSVTDITATLTSPQAKHTWSEIDKINELFMQAPVAICIVKGTMYLVELANQGMLQFLGRTTSMIGKPLIESLPEARLQGLISILDKVRLTGEAFYASDFPAVILIDGVRKQRYFDLIFKPFYTVVDGKEETHIFCVAHNVTDKVVATKKAQEVQERLNLRNAIYEAQNAATPDGVLIIDNNRKILLYNKSYVELWQVPQQLLDDKDEDKIIQHLSALVADPKVFIDNIEYVYAHREEPSHEEISLKDGRIIERNGTPIIGEDGTYYGVAWYFRDITTRKRQEYQLRSIIESAPFPIGVYIGKEMRIQFANQSILDVWGKGNDVVGKLYSEVLPELENQQIFQQLDDVYTTGVPFYAKNQQVDLFVDGQLRPYYFSYNFTPLLDEHGKVYGVLNTAAEVTDLVVAKRKVEENEKTLENIILQSPVALCILTGPEHVISIANDRMFELWGKPKEVMLNKPMFIALPEAKNQGFETILNTVYTTGKGHSDYGVPVTLPRADGVETVYINFVFEAFREGHGVISGIMAVATDVTVQFLATKKIEEAEERARLAVESGDQGTFEVNLLTNEMFASRRLAEIFDVEEDAERSRYVTALMPEDRWLREDAYKRAAQTNTLDYEARVIRKDGSVHWIRVKGRINYNEKNQPIRLLGVVQDITIEKEIQRQKDDFISIVSHELKTPITSLKAYAQILTRKFAASQDEESTTMLIKMNEQVKRLTYVIQDLLDVTRIEGNTVKFRKNAFDFSELVIQTVEEVQRATETHHFTIQKNPSIVVHADKERTSQVLINLLTNATNYSPKNSPIIVSVETQNDQLICSVQDFGSGIEKDKQKKIFERFYRATDRNRFNAGLGLGLFISAEIIKRQNGSIWVESEPNKGATFYFSLPLVSKQDPVTL